MLFFVATQNKVPLQAQELACLLFPSRPATATTTNHPILEPGCLVLQWIAKTRVGCLQLIAVLTNPFEMCDVSIVSRVTRLEKGQSHHRTNELETSTCLTVRKFPENLNHQNAFHSAQNFHKHCSNGCGPHIKRIAFVVSCMAI